MREILFRAKDTKKIWHIGLLAHIGNAWYISNKTGVSTAYEVIPSTIGQYIGRNGYDKNGELCYIYEGDICSVSLERGNYICKVEYCEGGFALTTVDNENFIWVGEMDDIVEELVLLGNIYDNPELLKS